MYAGTSPAASTYSVILCTFPFHANVNVPEFNKSRFAEFSAPLISMTAILVSPILNPIVLALSSGSAVDTLSASLTGFKYAKLVSMDNTAWLAGNTEPSANDKPYAITRRMSGLVALNSKAVLGLVGLTLSMSSNLKFCKPLMIRLV